VTELPAWLHERLPRDSDLDREALRELAVALGRERSLWEAHVRHDPDERYFTQLYRDAHVDVWLICWMNGQDTGFHDHDVSSGAVYVCDGVLAEDRLQRWNGSIREASIERPAEDVFDFDAAHIHRMRHPGGVPATSVHVYSPALWRMGYYEPDESGNLRRNSITYVDEMGAGRPWL
jgi:hypothetical protein